MAQREAGIFEQNLFVNQVLKPGLQAIDDLLASWHHGLDTVDVVFYKIYSRESKLFFIV